MSENVAPPPDSKPSTPQDVPPTNTVTAPEKVVPDAVVSQGNSAPSPEKVVPDDVKRLRGMTGILILFWLVVLVVLSWVALHATDSDVKRYYEKPTSTPALSGALTTDPNPTPSPAVSPAGSPAVAPGAVGTATALPKPSAIVSPTAETSPNESPTETPSPAGTVAQGQASPIESPTETPSPAGTVVQSQATPAATPTTSPGTNASPDAVAAAIAKPSPTPIPPTRQAAKFAARQHLVTLAALTATMVLFPWVLLLAFAFQSAPRMYRDLESDLKALGIYRSPEKIQMSEKDRQDLEKALEAQIRAGFKPDQRPAANLEAVRAAGLAKQLSSMAFLEGTAVGDIPVDVDPFAWEQASQRAWDIHVTNAKETERTRTGLTQRFGWVEFLLPLLSLTPIVLVSFVWALWPEASFGFVRQMVQSASLKDYFAHVVDHMSPAAVAVVTAYLFMMFGLVRRYHRSDITPGAYWEVLTRLIVVFLLGLVGTVLLIQGFDNGGTRTAAIFLGILAGVFPVGTLEAIVKLAESRLQQWLAGEKHRVDISLSRRLHQQHPLSMLDDLDAWDELRLTEEGVIGIQGMATADIAHLLVWTPFTTHQIVDWVDQSILFLAAGAEPDAQYVRTFRKMGLRGVSDLIDATRTPEDRARVVRAAEAIQNATPKEAQADTGAALIAAQRAAAEVQAKVKDAQERVSQVKDLKKDDALDKAVVTSALSAIPDAQKSIDAAVASVKAGGADLAPALETANALQAKFKAVGDKAGSVQTSLAAATDKVTEELEAALKALGEELTVEPDANSQAKAVSDALNKLAKPVAQTELAAKQFAEKVTAIQQKAETIQTDVPTEVAEAETLLNSLTKLAQETQESFKSDGAPIAAISSMDELVKLVTDEGADKPKQLITELKKKDDWTTAGTETKAKSHDNAEKLAGQAAEILKHAQAASTAVGAQVGPDATDTAVMVSLPLTMNVLVTLLHGLERNPNLRRILRYLTSEVENVPAPGRYVTNNDWLGTLGNLPIGGTRTVSGTNPGKGSGNG